MYLQVAEKVTSKSKSATNFCAFELVFFACGSKRFRPPNTDEPQNHTWNHLAQS